MNTLEINIDNRSEIISYPSAWNELSLRQLIDISSLFLEKKSETDFRAEAVIRLIGNKSLLFKKWVWLHFKIASRRRSKNYEELEQLTDQLNGLSVSIYRISETLEFLFKENNLVINLLKSYKGFYGPSDFFGNLTLIEFTKADIRCRSYENTNDDKYLNELIAVLYRPSKFMWGIREKFTADDDPRVEYGDKYIKNSDKIAKWPKPVRNAIYIYYKGCMTKLSERYPHIFMDNGVDNEQPGFGMAGLITALAGEKFGNPDKTANTMLHHVLIHLEQEAIVAETLKSKTDEK